MRIPWDLETKSLQIKTDSVLGSGERIVLWMCDKDNNWIGNVDVTFSSTVQYIIAYCTHTLALPVQPPDEVNKIWTITKTETAFIITCNDVEVLNFLFTDSSDDRCVPRWGGGVEQIRFIDSDSASDYHRAGEELNSHSLGPNNRPAL